MRLNIVGYKWLWFDGYGRFCLKTAQNLIRQGHEVYPLDIGALDNPAWFLRAQGLSFDHVTVQIMPPDMMRALPGRSIAYTMHETTRIHREWASYVNNNNQFLLVPAEFLVEVFRDGGVKLPIHVVKSGIDPDECQIVAPRRNGPYTFGCWADREGRKGHRELYDAFYKAFDHRNRDVRLVLKCRPGSQRNMDFSYSSDDRLTVWQADVQSIPDIFSQFNAFIFPTKCEGWGQPPREAAACGLPVVCTQWSGTDDETDKWAYPLTRFEIVDSGVPSCGGDWAQPNTDELVFWMRWLYEHQDEARVKGLQSAAWLRANRTYAQAVDGLVETLSLCLGGPTHQVRRAPDVEAIKHNERTLAALEAVAPHSNGHRLEVVK